ncbi:MAG: LPS export ABC transporter permease LptG [Alphaproteobacteria bacterium]|nr:LPS export ABC transporter permease LptG [Alphaproteobacteria bacterium]
MTLSPTLFIYIGRQFLLWFLAVFLAMIAVIILIDAAELLRRSSTKSDATTAIITSMALMRAPFLAQETVPFAAMFGGILTYFRLTRNHELVVIRSAGVSVWQFMLPALLVVVMIGVAKVTLLNPLSSVLLSKFEELEGRYLTGRSSLLAVSSSGIWLRQTYGDDGQAVIHAQSIEADELNLREVIVFLLGDEDRFIGRIDAKSARLGDGQWDLTDAWLTGPEKPGELVTSHSLATDLTADKIQDSFASPETVSFWSLPRFIKILEETGFSALPHQLQLHTLLAEPILLIAMVMIAASFSMRLSRRGGASLLLGAGVLTAFLLFILTNVVHAIGLGGGVPVLLAAWTPAGVSLMAGIALLMHLEDG